jgi:hypothetical protein
MSERTMNAVTASVLVWHYYRAGLYCAGTPHGESSSVSSAYHYLSNNELIKAGPCNAEERTQIVLTDKGKVLVEHWLSTPLPVAFWKVER